MVPRLAFSALALLVLVPAFAPAARAQQDISIQEALLRVKPGVALVIAEVAAEVTLDCGGGPLKATPPPYRETGTGWFIDAHGWLVTNAHVVQPAHETPRWLLHEMSQRAVTTACLPAALKRAGLEPGQRPESEDAIRRRMLDTALPTAKVSLTPHVLVLLSNGTSLTARVQKYSPPLSPAAGTLSGRDLALLKVPGEHLPMLPLADARPPRIGDLLHILGFPGVVLSHELLNRSASVEASVTMGTVSGFKQDKNDNPVIQTDAPAAWGNSGGPAVNDDGEVVGVLTFVSLAPGPQGGIVQGFNFVIPAAVIREFVSGTPVDLDRPSSFNQLWYEGLEAFFDDDWEEAEQLFAQADKLLPGLPDVKRMLAEARERVKNPPPRPFPWRWTALGVTLVSVGGFGGLLVARWRRNRHRVTPPDVVRMLGQGTAPLFVDARTKHDYDTSPLVLPGAIRADPEEVEAGRLKLDLDPAQLVVVYCATPGEATSARLARLLRARGHDRVKILKGGLGAWANASLPVESKSHLPALAIELYKSLAPEDLEQRRVGAGELIFRQGDGSGGEAFMVHAGKVDIVRGSGAAQHTVARLGEGELFGEMALFRRAARSASAVAATDVELLVVRAERLEWLIRNRPQLTIELLRRLSEVAAAEPPPDCSDVKP